MMASKGRYKLRPADHSRRVDAFLVMTSCCLCTLVSQGLEYSPGSVYLDIMDTFSASRPLTALVQSLCLGLGYGAGIVTGPMIGRCGGAVTMAAGGVLCCAGCIGSSLAPSIYVLVVCFGGVTGVGVSCLFLASIVVMGTMFHAKRHVTIPMAIMSGGVGMAAFPALVRWLADMYGLRGAFLVIGGLALQCTLFAVVIHTSGSRLQAAASASGTIENVVKKEEGASYDKGRDEGEARCERKTIADTIQTFQPRIHPHSSISASEVKERKEDADDFRGQDEREPSRESDLTADIRTSTAALQLSGSVSISDDDEKKEEDTSANKGRNDGISREHDAATAGVKEETIMADDNRQDRVNLSCPEGKSGTSAGNTNSGFSYEGEDISGATIESTATVPARSEGSPPEDSITSEDQTSSRAVSKRWSCSATFQTVLLTNARYVLITLFSYSTVLTLQLPSIVLTDIVQARGISVEQGTKLLVIMFACNVGGRGAVAVVQTLCKLSMVPVFGVVVLSCGASVFAFTLVDYVDDDSAFAAYTAVCVLAGTCLGLMVTSSQMTCLEVVDLDQYAQALGYQLFIGGICISAGGPLGGWVKDTTGSYNIIFYTALAQGVIAFIVIVAIVCCTRHSPDANTIAMDTDDVDHREGTCNLAFTANLDEFCTHL